MRIKDQNEEELIDSFATLHRRSNLEVRRWVGEEGGGGESDGGDDRERERERERKRGNAF